MNNTATGFEMLLNIKNRNKFIWQENESVNVMSQAFERALCNMQSSVIKPVHSQCLLYNTSTDWQLHAKSV